MECNAQTDELPPNPWLFSTRVPEMLSPQKKQHVVRRTLPAFARRFPVAQIFDVVMQIVNKKAGFGQTFPKSGECPVRPGRQSQFRPEQNGQIYWSGLDTWYLLSFLSSVDLSIPRIWAARDLFHSV